MNWNQWKAVVADTQIGGIEASRLIVAVTITVLVWIILYLARSMARRRLHEVVQGSVDTAREIIYSVIVRTRSFFIIIVGVALGFLLAGISGPGWIRGLNLIAVVASLLQFGFWASALVSVLVRFLRPDKSGDPEGGFTGQSLFTYLGNVIVWTVILLLILDNVGVDITALVASLGIGGIALALALQAVLGDLLASLSIILDKPFNRGDFISMGDICGTIEKIGLRSTLMRSLGGEVIVIPNKDLISSQIHNFKKMERRRRVFRVGVIYQTDPDKLRQIPQLLQEAIEPVEHTTFDRAHFCEFGDSSLIFEVVYYVESPDYLVHMDAQQTIYLGIAAAFSREAIEFAYPTHTVMLQR